MIRKRIALAVLSLWLASPVLQAADAQPASPAPAASAVAPEAIDALRKMGSYLQTLQRYEIAIDLVSEVVLADGQKLQRSADLTFQVQRPNKMKAVLSSPRTEQEGYYDGKTFTWYNPEKRYYASMDAPDTLKGLVKDLREGYGLDLPEVDLFRWGGDDAPVEGITSAMNAGQDIIGKDLCDHYAFRQGDVDWQIWIAAGERPLPLKVVITDRTDEARPQSVKYITWNLKPSFRDSTFRFVPPKGAAKVPMKPRTDD
jgi:hypothetical protein